jgi:hypothetical protein
MNDEDMMLMESILEMIENTPDTKYLEDLKGQDLKIVLEDLTRIKVSAQKIVDDTIEDPKEARLYELFSRQLKCVTREINLVNFEIAKRAARAERMAQND